MYDCWSGLKCLHMVIQIPEENFKVLAKVVAIENDKICFQKLRVIEREIIHL